MSQTNFIDTGNSQNKIDAPIEKIDTILPWQKYFLDSTPDLNHYTQSKLLTTISDFNDSLLEKIIEVIMTHHEFLRTSFTKKVTGWEASLKTFSHDEILEIIQRIDLDDFEESDREECITFCCEQAQQSLNIFEGSLIKIIHFKESNKGKLFIAIHRLAIDNFSWHILLKDFSNIYNQLSHSLPIQFEHNSIQFFPFINQLQTYFTSSELLVQKKHWEDCLGKSWIGSIPADNPNSISNNRSETKYFTIEWSREITSTLLNQCRNVYHTDLITFLIAALFKTIKQITGESSVRLNMPERVCHSNSTIGPLTYSYPLTLNIPHDATLEKIINTIKQQRAQVPDRGIGFDFLRYTVKDKEIIAKTKNIESWICFDFTDDGKNNLIDLKSCFSNITEGIGTDVNPEIPRASLLQFKGSIVDEQLQFIIDYNGSQYHSNTIANLANLFKQSVHEVSAHCQLPYVGGYIPTDFPLSTLSAFEIADLSYIYNTIENIYPISYTQKNIIYHSYHQSETNINQVIFSLEGKANIEYLKTIWDRIIHAYPILRSIFYGDFENLHQVVLAELLPEWTNRKEIKATNESTIDAFDNYAKLLRTQSIAFNGPLLNFHVVEVSNKSYKLIWNVHQALLDQNSIKKIASIFTDMLRSKLGETDTMKNAHDISSPLWFAQQDFPLAKTYWEQHLIGIEDHSFLFEENLQDSYQLKQYQSFATILSKDLKKSLELLSKNTTASIESIILSAYGIALQAYTNKKAICIGMVTSYLPETLQNSTVIGAFEDITPSVLYSESLNLPVLDFLQKNHADNMERKKYLYNPSLDHDYKSPFETILYIDNSSSPQNIEIHSLYEKGYPLNLLSMLNEDLKFIFNFDLTIFTEQSIADFSQHFTNVLEALCSNTDTAVNSLPIYKNNTLSTKKNIFPGKDIDLPRLSTEERSIRQTKIRGFKVDFNRIESQINSIDNIQKSLVVLKNNKLIAFVTGSKNDNTEILVRSLSKNLPSYMIPESFFWIDDLSVLDSQIELQQTKPIERNNLIDKRIIKTPKNQTEEIVLKIWKEVLGVDSIKTTASFFELGGNSLKAITIYSKIKTQGLSVTIMDIFESKTIEQLSFRIINNRKTIKLKQSDDIKGLGKLLPFHISYFSHHTNKAWNLSKKQFYPDRLNEKLLGIALNHLYDFHDALRIQFIIPPDSVSIMDIKMLNLSKYEIRPTLSIYNWEEYTEEEFASLVNQDIVTIESRNKHSGPDLNAFCLYKGPHGDYFYIMSSHLICDASSLELIKSDLFNWYNLLNAGLPIKLEDKTDSYIRFSKELFKYANSTKIIQEIPFAEHIYATFKNNLLIPRDFDIEKSNRHNRSYRKKILWGSDLHRIENNCQTNQSTVIDLILICFGQTIKEWCGIEKIGTLFIVSGREFPYADIDISRTVGCLASAIYLDIDNSEPSLTMLQKSKLQFQKREYLPNKGLASSLLLHLNYYRALDYSSELLKKMHGALPANTAYISFNYFDQRTYNRNAVQENKSDSSQGEFGTGDRDSVFFKLNLYHTDHHILLSWTYNALEYTEKTIVDLTATLETTLLAAY